MSTDETQLNSTQLSVELSCVASVDMYRITTQLNSTQLNSTDLRAPAPVLDSRNPVEANVGQPWI
jgi:hypothetical protein